MEDKRIWEIDLLRAIAIILMVIFHLVFDLNQFAGMKNINYVTGFWFWEGKITALIFIFLAGISSGLSKNTVKNGLRVLAFAMMITLVTYILFREQYIRFGILHLLATGMLLSPWLQRLNNFLLVLVSGGIAIAALPVKTALAPTSLLLPFGVVYQGYTTFDYYPLIPYLSVFILGILAYKIHYDKRRSIFKFQYENSLITMISKNSLYLYLIHQPIIVAVIFLFKYFLA